MNAPTQPRPFQSCEVCGSSVCRDQACLLALDLADRVPEGGWEIIRPGGIIECDHVWLSDLAFNGETPVSLTRCCAICTQQEEALAIPSVLVEAA